MARKVANYAKWTQEEWQTYRRNQKGLGGSDIAAALGVSSYKTPRRLWAELAGVIERKDISHLPAVKMGHKLEPIVADLFAEQTGLKVRRNNWILQHDTIDYLYANIDREVIMPDGSRAVLECKTANYNSRKMWQGEQVPKEYMAQCQYYMAITGASKCFLAVLIGGVDFEYWEIDRNEKIIADILEGAAAFWRCVETGAEPSLDGSEDAAKLLLETYREAEASKTITLDHTDYEKIEVREILQKQKAELEQQINTIDNYFKEQIGKAGAVTALVKDREVKWGITKRKKVDTKALKAAYPSIVQRYEAAAAKFTTEEIGRRINY